MNTVSLLVLLASLIELWVVSTRCNTKQTTCQVFNKMVIQVIVALIMYLVSVLMFLPCSCDVKLLG